MISITVTCDSVGCEATEEFSGFQSFSFGTKDLKYIRNKWVLVRTDKGIKVICRNCFKIYSKQKTTVVNNTNENFFK